MTENRKPRLNHRRSDFDVFRRQPVSGSINRWYMVRQVHNSLSLLVVRFIIRLLSALPALAAQRNRLKIFSAKPTGSFSSFGLKASSGSPYFDATAPRQYSGVF